MAAAQLSLPAVERIRQFPAVVPELNHTQRTLLEIVHAVRNLRDEDDVQCLLFIAEEFALLHPNPFYFSMSGDDGARSPRSLVLRDTLRALLAAGLIGLENGTFRPQSDRFGPLPASMLSGRIAWLATLTPRERRALALIARDLRDCGISVRAPDAECRVRKAAERVLGGEADDALIRRLSAIRHQLSGN